MYTRQPILYYSVICVVYIFTSCSIALYIGTVGEREIMEQLYYDIIGKNGVVAKERKKIYIDQ